MKESVHLHLSPYYIRQIFTENLQQWLVEKLLTSKQIVREGLSTDIKKGFGFAKPIKWGENRKGGFGHSRTNSKMPPKDCRTGSISHIIINSEANSQIRNDFLRQKNSSAGSATSEPIQ
jgi:hypothetical protein